MSFTSADPSVVRNIMQRALLNAWLRAGRSRLPLLAEFDPGDISGERPDMMGCDVEGESDDARFIIRQEGARLTSAYGTADPAKAANRYLHETIGELRYARVVATYLACLQRRRPIYSISRVLDADGKEVSYERLLLPFGSDNRVVHIVGSFKAISLEGGIKVKDLMALQADRVPVTLIQAVIDRTHATPAGARTADDVVEIG